MKEALIMELYLFFSFLLFYLITAFLLKPKMREKIWTIAFIISFIITSISIGFLRVSQQNVMMDANQLNWYYFLYLFGMISVVLGVFNLWIYRKPLRTILFSTDKEDDSEENEA